jgi:hypothetical protein
MEMVAGTMKFGMWNGSAISSITSTVATPPQYLISLCDCIRRDEIQCLCQRCHGRKRHIFSTESHRRRCRTVLCHGGNGSHQHG